MKSVLIITQTKDNLTHEAYYRLLNTLAPICNPTLLQIDYFLNSDRVCDGVELKYTESDMMLGTIGRLGHFDVYLFWYGGHKSMIIPVILIKLFRRRKKIIVRIDGTGSQVHRSLGDWWLTKIHSIMETLLFSCADIIACQYQELAVDCRLSKYAHKLRLANQFVDTEVFGQDYSFKTGNPKLRKDRYFDLMFCGRLDHNKGIMEFLRAIDYLKNTLDMDLKVVIAGDGELYNEVQNYIIDHKLHISFVGKQPIAEIANLMADSRFLVIPSRMEGVPKVALEAMVSGCIPIASKAGGLKYLVRHWCTGFVIQEITPEAISNAIITAIRCPVGRIDEILLKYKSILVDYSFEVVQKRYQQIIGR
jgi:glycosyltransferase involved in cell wall biosynthesis